MAVGKVCIKTGGSEFCTSSPIVAYRCSEVDFSDPYEGEVTDTREAFEHLVSSILRRPPQGVSTEGKYGTAIKILRLLFLEQVRGDEPFVITADKLGEPARKQG